MTNIEAARIVRRRSAVTLASLESQPRWVAWRLEYRGNKDGEQQETKVPHDPHNQQHARANDPDTWGTRAEAQRRWERLRPRAVRGVGGVGLILGELGDGRCLVGIDLDGCVKRDTGEIRAWARDILRRFDTYAEISPSGKGVKLFFVLTADKLPEVKLLMGQKTRLQFSVSTHKEIALDRTSRYYAVTAQRLPDMPETFRAVAVEDVRWLLQDAVPRFLARFGSQPNEQDGGRDNSGSGFGYRFMRECKAAGKSFEQACAAITADRGQAGGWARRVDERQLQRAWDNAQVSGEKSYELVCAADVVPRSIDWFWKGHLARGQQELTAGEKGLCKSQAQCSWVASATAGKPWPDGTTTEPANVIMVTAEDCLDQVVVPRLIAAGADLQRVHILKRIKQDDKRRSFLLGEDLELLERIITDKQAMLVTLDPITAFMGKLNSHMATDVRGTLGPLTDLAERSNTAIATITHPPKEGGANAMNHFIGSRAFIDNARIGHLCVAEMRSNEDGAMKPTGRVLFTNPGINIWRTMPTLVYCREDKIIGKHPHRIETTRIEWLEGITLDITANEAVAASRATPARTTQADQCLRNLLSRGAAWASDVFAAAASHGFSQDQMKRASERLGVVKDKRGLGGWKWSLPARERRREPGEEG